MFLGVVKHFAGSLSGFFKMRHLIIGWQWCTRLSLQAALHPGPRVSAPISSLANGAVVDGASLDTLSMVPGTQKHFSTEKEQDAGGGEGGGASPCL